MAVGVAPKASSTGAHAAHGRRTPARDATSVSSRAAASRTGARGGGDCGDDDAACTLDAPAVAKCCPSMPARLTAHRRREPQQAHATGAGRDDDGASLSGAGGTRWREHHHRQSTHTQSPALHRGHREDSVTHQQHKHVARETCRGCQPCALPIAREQRERHGDACPRPGPGHHRRMLAPAAKTPSTFFLFTVDDKKFKNIFIWSRQ